MRLSLKKDLLKTASEEEQVTINEEIEWINDDIRYIQSEIGASKRDLQNW